MPNRDDRGGFQHASPLGHVPTIQHPLVRETLARYQMPSTRVGDVEAIHERLVDPEALDQPTVDAQWVVAADSSPFEHEVDPAFPSTRLLFMQMAAVLVDLTKLHHRSGHFVDPAAIKDAQRASVLAGVLPSSNLLRVDEIPPRRAFREEIDQLFRTSEVEGRTLLQVLLDVEAERETLSVQAGSAALSRCPNEECNAEIPKIPVGLNGAFCPSCAEPLLAVDALRCHEKFTEHGSNLEACSRVMSVAERFILLALLEHLRERRPSLLGEIGFITDGPLALFGEVASVKWPLLRLLQKIAEAQRVVGMGIPIVLGIEKSGQFYEHGVAIAQHIPEGMLMRLDQAYVERYITFRGSTHGKDTYYGRHFFYRSAVGEIFTLTVPPLGRLGAHAHDEFDYRDYPTLRASCRLLDRIGTRLYENATIPVVLAHQWVAFPLSQAGRVLKLHAEEHLHRSGELPTSTVSVTPA